MHKKMFNKLLGGRLNAVVFLAVLAVPFIGTAQVVATGYIPTPTQSQDAIWTGLNAVKANIPLADHNGPSTPYDATFDQEVSASSNSGQITVAISRSEANAIDTYDGSGNGPGGGAALCQGSSDAQYNNNGTETNLAINNQYAAIQIGDPTIPGSYKTATTYTLTVWFDSGTPFCGAFSFTDNYYNQPLDNTWVSANYDATWDNSGGNNDINWNYPGYSPVGLFVPQNNTSSNDSMILANPTKVTSCKQDNGSTITFGPSNNYFNATTAIWTISNPEDCTTTENITIALSAAFYVNAPEGTWINATTISYQGVDYYGSIPTNSPTMTLQIPLPASGQCGLHDSLTVGDSAAGVNAWQTTQGKPTQPTVSLQGYSPLNNNPCNPNTPMDIELTNTWSDAELGLSNTQALWSGPDQLTFPNSTTDPNTTEFNGSDPAGGIMTLYGAIEPVVLPGSTTTPPTPTTCTSTTTPNDISQSEISITFPSSSGSNAYTTDGLSATLMAYNPNNGCQQIPVQITITNAYCDENPDNSNCPGYQAAAGDSCPITDGGALQWLLCPVYTVVNDAIVNALSPALKTFLYTPGSFFTNTGFQQTSATFRDVGIALLVIGGLVMVVSQAAGLEIFAAYTIRKALPRLVIAMIGIALAVPILQFIVTFFNDIGSWAQQLILIAGGGSGSPGSIWSGLFTGTGIIATGIAVLAGAVIIISMLGTLLLAFLVAFLVLTIRQLVILICIIIAPLAIASAVLPGTNKLWKFWENTLLTSLIMFPIIMAFLGAGMALSQIAGQVGSSGSLLDKTTWDLMAIAALIAPLIMLPFTFMMAGGLMSTVTAAVRNKSQGGFKLLSGVRQQKLGQRFQAAKEGSLFREGTFGNNVFGRNVDRLARRGSSMAQGVALFGQEPGRARRRALIANTNMAKAMENLEKNGSMAAITPNEDLLYAGMSGTMFNDGTTSTGSQADVRKYLTEKGYTGRTLDQYTQQVMLAKRSVGARNFDIAAAVAIAGTGTGYGTKDGGAGRMLTTINRVAGNDRQLATSMMARASQLGLQAKRVDLGGAGFGTRLTALNRLHDDPGHYSEADATIDLQRGALRGQSAYSTFAAARVDAVKQLAPLVMKDLNGAFSFSGTPADRDAMIKRQLAYIANAYDGAQSASPEAAEAYVEQVLAMKTPLATGTPLAGMSVRQMLDAVRGDGTFQLYRREYRSELGATGGAPRGPGAPGGPVSGGPDGP